VVYPIRWELRSVLGVMKFMDLLNEHRLPKFLAAALKHQLIVLDELGFIPFSPTGAQLIFQFCSTLYERVAMIVTSSLRFADWTQVFGEASTTEYLRTRTVYPSDNH